MIKSFAFDDVLYTIVPPEVLHDPKKNIFSADSMTLFVGPNGCGKTVTLLSLGNKISVTTPTEVQIDWKNESDADSTFALYFTPIPYATQLPANTAKFLAIHPNRTRGEILPDVKTAIELAKEFGLEASPQLILSPLSQAINSLKEILLQPFRHRASKYKLNDDDWIASWAARKIEFDDRYLATSRKMREDGKNFSEWFNTRERHDLMEEEKLIDAGLANSILKRIGDDASLKLRAFDVVKKEQKFTKDVILQLLNQLNLSPQVSPSKVQKKSMARYEESLSIFREIKSILGKSNLIHDHHKLTVNKWNALATLALSGIAKLSLAGTSSGSAALLDQFARLKKAISEVSSDESIRNLLLLIDEGDAFLHLEWQQQYINFLDLTIKKLWRKRFDCIQVILTTHSPVLMSDFPKDCIHRLVAPRDGLEKLQIPEVLSFGAPLETIVRSVGGAGTLGAFSVRIMRKMLEDLAAGSPPSQYHLDMIDDPVIHRQIQRVLATKN